MFFVAAYNIRPKTNFTHFKGLHLYPPDSSCNRTASIIQRSIVWAKMIWMTSVDTLLNCFFFRSSHSRSTKSRAINHHREYNAIMMVPTTTTIMMTTTSTPYMWVMNSGLRYENPLNSVWSRFIMNSLSVGVRSIFSEVNWRSKLDTSLRCFWMGRNGNN